MTATTVIFRVCLLTPLLCFATYASNEKVLGAWDKDTGLSRSVTVLIGWIVSSVVLALAMYQRHLGRPDLESEYTYVGACLVAAIMARIKPDMLSTRTQVVFTILPWIVPINLYALALISWSDGILLWFTLITTCARVTRDAYDAAQSSFIPSMSSDVREVVSYTETGLLLVMCTRSAWITGSVSAVPLSILIAFTNRLEPDRIPFERVTTHDD